LALIRFDTYRTPVAIFDLGLLIDDLGKCQITNQKSKIRNAIWQVVVPPILFYSVIYLETLLFGEAYAPLAS
jgi:hypothetical protein